MTDILQSQIESIEPVKEFVTLEVSTATANLFEQLAVVSRNYNAVAAGHAYHTEEIERHGKLEAELRGRLQGLYDQSSMLVKQIAESFSFQKKAYALPVPNKWTRKVESLLDRHVFQPGLVRGCCSVCGGTMENHG